ncbi:hypothetical protein [Marinigracilibium pacificum]|uniref:Uncharacterized protein n=1 Tax=Marinigracilibium pacificum TaxID=2729599 RepID=A0A848J136_9BACT|nr:hypothetical protein [Marinigracilibium pacificum]NMM48194.1 hypothetical protein [Marinigracilibium pacificum]
MKVRLFLINIFIVLGLLNSSCDIKEDELSPDESFIKVYDVNNFNLDLEPVDIIQAQDSGYIVLSKDRNEIPNILELDGEGNIKSIRTTSVEGGGSFTKPIGELMEIDNSIYFVGMNTNQEAVLFKIEEGKIGTREYSNVYQPLAVSKGPGSEILIAGYSSLQGDEIVTETSTFYVMNPNSSVPKYSYNFRTEDAFTDDMINSYLNGEADFPFFTGYIGNETSATTYFVNTFYNFNLTTLFLNPSNDPDAQIKGGVIGDKYSGSLLSMVHLDGDKFATAYNHLSDYYLNSANQFNINGFVSGSDSTEVRIPEIDDQSEVIIKNVEINGVETLIYAAQNKRKQVVMYSYDPTTGNFIGNLTLGNQSPYKAIDFEVTSDGGMIILAKTYVGQGRFGRIALFKLTTDQISNLIQ